MPGDSVKKHPFYARMQYISPAEIASSVLGNVPIEHADKLLRKDAFRRVAKDITRGKAERAKYGFTFDANGQIARAMEWAFQAGVKSVKSR